jgi:hypothetical protein
MRVALRRIARNSAMALGAGMILAALSASASAVPLGTPEIDPGAMASALTLLVGGMLMIAGRKQQS